MNIIESIGKTPLVELTKVTEGINARIFLKSEFFLYWDDDCRDTAYRYKGEKTLYNDMFDKLQNVNYIDENEFNKLIQSSINILRINYCESFMHRRR